VHQSTALDVMHKNKKSSRDRLEHVSREHRYNYSSTDSISRLQVESRLNVNSYHATQVPHS